MVETNKPVVPAKSKCKREMRGQEVEDMVLTMVGLELVEDGEDLMEMMEERMVIKGGGRWTSGCHQLQHGEHKLRSNQGRRQRRKHRNNKLTLWRGLKKMCLTIIQLICCT
jgi:hypothetical protein